MPMFKNVYSFFHPSSEEESRHFLICHYITVYNYKIVNAFFEMGVLLFKTLFSQCLERFRSKDIYIHKLQAINTLLLSSSCFDSPINYNLPMCPLVQAQCIGSGRGSASAGSLRGAPCSIRYRNTCV